MLLILVVRWKRFVDSLSELHPLRDSKSKRHFGLVMGDAVLKEITVILVEVGMSFDTEGKHTR